MERHAFMVMAHDNWRVLALLLALLDHPGNDIYLHIDKQSSPPAEIRSWKPVHSRLVAIERINVAWADYSQVEVTLALLRAATENSRYGYYHLLSGSDLPVKRMEHIHAFFAGRSAEFVAVVPRESWYSVRRVKFYHMFTRFGAYRTSKPLKALDRVLEYAQRVVGVNRLRRHAGMKIYDGWQWFSITDGLARLVVASSPFIESVFKHSIAPDELFLQTLVMNSDRAGTLHDLASLQSGCMRAIDWTRGKPYVFSKDDVGDLLAGPALFARKFSETHDMAAVLEVAERLGEGRPPSATGT